MRLHRALVTLAAIVVLARGLSGAEPPTELLDRYAAGDVDAVVKTLDGNVAGFEAFAKQLKASAPVWIAAAGPAAVSRRRLIVGTVALEAVRPAMPTDPRLPLRASASRLIEWACELLRSTNPPLAAERWWFLASIGVASTDHVQHGIVPGHIAHASERFPDEPRFRLEKVVAQEVGTTGGTYDWLSHGPDMASSFMKPFDRKYEGLIRAYADLSANEAVRAEAHLRAGVLEYRFGHVDAALAHLDEVEPWTSERFLVFLSRFFRAKTLAFAGRDRDAETMYRAALTTVPNAESAATALATSLFVRDSRPEAFELIGSALAAQPTTVDPWRLYEDGDFRRVPEFMAKLREALR